MSMSIRLCPCPILCPSMDMELRYLNDTVLNSYGKNYKIYMSLKWLVFDIYNIWFLLNDILCLFYRFCHFRRFVLTCFHKLHLMSLETFCPYTFCHVRHFVVIRFVVIQFVVTCFVMTRFVIICFVVIHSVTESRKLIKIIIDKRIEVTATCRF